VTSAAKELDWHLRRHGLGSVEASRIRFDWGNLAARRLVLIPNYEQNSRPIYAAIRKHVPTAAFLIADLPPVPIPDPDQDLDFFVGVESEISSVSDADGRLVCVNAFTEEAYLALTPEAGEAIFDESAIDLLARSFARCVAQDILFMRRHRHGLRIFRDALRHFDALVPIVPMPESVMLW
jgi:hypothetical protein